MLYRNSLVLVTSLSLLACGASRDSDETVRESGDEIVGGQAFSGLPAVGALMYDGSQSCTGTLISKRTVATAAHCAYGHSASRMTFVIGPNAYSPQASLRVVSAKVHPQYNPSSISNDIALVTLAQDAPVAPMNVLDHMDSSWVRRNMLFVGYGTTSGTSRQSGQKRAVTIALSQVSSTTFRYDDPNKNTCYGDSGGPAFFIDSSNQYWLAGVTSWGDQGCNQFGVDTRTDAYRDFLGVNATPPAPSTTPTTPTTPTPSPVPVAGSTCPSSLSFAGQCNGNIVSWCEGGVVHQTNCGAQGYHCGYNAHESYYDCL